MSKKISFAPLEPDAVRFLMARTGIDYRHCQFDQPQWFCATARDEDGRILGALIGEFTTWFECQMSCAIDHPRFLTRRLLRAIFTAIFSQAVRITAYARPDNERSINGLKRMGFQPEGYMRLAIEGKWNALVFGLLRHECRYLGKMPPIFSSSDAPDVAGRHIETFGKINGPITGSANSDDIGHHEFGIGIGTGLLGMNMSPLQSGRYVFASRLPLQMPGIDAAKVAVVTEVSSLRFGERSRSMNLLADEPSNEVGTAIQSKDGITSFVISGVGPKQTTGVAKRKDNLAEKPLRFAVESAAAEWVAMSAPSVPVHPAQALGNNTFETAINFATGKHVDDNANVDERSQ